MTYGRRVQCQNVPSKGNVVEDYHIITSPSGVKTSDRDACYEWGKKEYKLNSLLYMNDSKLFDKNGEQID